MTPTPVPPGPVALGPTMRGGASEPTGPVTIGDEQGHFAIADNKLAYMEMLENQRQTPYLGNQCRNSMSISNTKGLLNMPGQNNCFLNSAVQVLWHLDIFRRSFRELSGHACMADSCIFCALKELFAQFQYSRETALPPDALRRALAETFFDQRRFQLGFMDDAAECFENILLRIHCHIASQESEDMCSAGHCIPHQKFAMTLVEQTVCHACGATSEPLPFTQMVHYVSASALCTQARLAKERATGMAIPDAFGNLMKTAGGMGDVRDCPSSCGAKIQIQKTLMNNPEILSVGLVWDSERPSLDHIMEVFDTIGLTIKLQDVFHSVVDKSWASSTVHHLVGVVTYYGKHYSTFFFHSKLAVWIYFDDAAVREIGPHWEQVVEKCRRGHFQPLLLLYADPNGTPVSVGSAPCSITYIPGQKKIPGPCLVTDHLKGRLGRTGTPSDFLTNGLTPTPQITYLTGNSELVDQVARRAAFEENCTCRNEQRSYEECDIHGTYISRKAVEHVLNFQKLQRQRSLNGSFTSGHGSVGSRNSSSSLESFENNNSVHQPQQAPLPKNSLLAMVDVKSNRQGPTPSSVGMSLNFPRRRDSGNWSGDRNSASSASSTSLDNPYVFLPGRRHAHHVGPVVKSRHQDPNLILSDQGYDSFSLSSTDSYPSIGNGSPLKIDNRLGQILENVQLDLPNGTSSKHNAENALSTNKNHQHHFWEDCDKLCAEADLLLNKSNEKEQEGDLAMAALYSDAAAAKARQAMDAPYSNNQSMVSAKMKHSLCVMRSSNIHRRIKEAEAEERRRLKEQQSNLESHHHRQSSRDSTHSRHSRQSSKDSTHSHKQANSSSPKNTTTTTSFRSGSVENFEKLGSTIEIYATLPKKGSKKKSCSYEDVLSKNFDDAGFLNKKEETSTMTRKEILVASPQTPTPTRYAVKNELSNFFYSKDPQESLGDYWTRQETVIPQPRHQNSLSRTLSGPANAKESPEHSKESTALSNKKQHKIRRKLMGGLMRRKNRSLPDLREGQDQSESAKSSAYDDTELVLGFRSPKTKESQLENISTSNNSDYLSEDNSYVSRGFHQPHRAFVSRDFYQRPLLVKVNPPKVDEIERLNAMPQVQPEMYQVQPLSESSYQPLADHPEVTYQNQQVAHIQSLRPRPLLEEARKNLTTPTIKTQNNYYANIQNQAFQGLTSPVVERRTGLVAKKNREFETNLKPANFHCVQSLNSPNWVEAAGQSILPCRKTFATSAEELPVANSSFLAELQAKRSQILESNGTSQPEKANGSNHSKGNWLEELRKKQQQIQLSKREMDVRASREDSKITKPMSPATTLRTSSISSPQKGPLKMGLDSPDGKYLSRPSIAYVTPNHITQIQPGTSDDTQSKTVKDLASRFEHVLYAKPLQNQNNDVENNQPSDVNEKSGQNINHTVEMTTMVPGRLFTVTSSSVPHFGTSSPQTCYGEMMEIRPPESGNGMRLDSSPITGQLSGYKMPNPQEGGDVRRPQKPPDYETAIQRLGFIRDIRSASPMENGLNKAPFEPQNAFQQETMKKIRSPKKSVTFSDQVVLVACADDRESDFLPNPLLERVYKQHGMRTDTDIIEPNNRVTIPNSSAYQTVAKDDPDDKVLCNLCHQQRVPAQAVYCTDCSFYVARFSPKKH